MAKINYVKINDTINYIENVAYLSELPIANSDSADFVSVNNELYVKQVNGTTYNYAKVGGSGGLKVVEITEIKEFLPIEEVSPITITSERFNEIKNADVLDVVSGEGSLQVVLKLYKKTTTSLLNQTLFQSFVEFNDTDNVLESFVIQLAEFEGEYVLGAFKMQSQKTESAGGLNIVDLIEIEFSGEKIIITEERYNTLASADMVRFGVEDMFYIILVKHYKEENYVKFVYIDDPYINDDSGKLFGGVSGYSLILNKENSDYTLQMGQGEFQIGTNTGSTPTEILNVLQLGNRAYQVSPIGVNLNSAMVPSTATNGTLDSSVLATLQENDQNYIVFNNEIFKLADKQHNAGYLVYSHNGHDTTGCFFQKCITITVSSRAWVLEEQENASKTYVNEQITSAYGFDVSVDGETLVFDTIGDVLQGDY